MKQLTLHQPWATLVALGVKTVETRGWATRYRGPLAIHAAKIERPLETAIVALPEFHDALWPALGCQERPMPAVVRERLPRGAVVATCTLVDCLPIRPDDQPYPSGLRGDHVSAGPNLLAVWRDDSPNSGRMRTIADQRPFGDFTPGRWAWLLADIEPVDPPAPAQGGRGLIKEWHRA